MSERWEPLDREPVSVYPPFVSYPGDGYRHESFEERQAALLAVLEGVELGAYDEHLVRWIAAWNVTVAAGLVSLLGRVRQTAAHPGGESR
ncbi:MAG: hypothetical protein ACRDR6_11495 [Pseudonocardiaceae bacterium]